MRSLKNNHMALRQFFSERKNLRVGSSVKLLETEANHIRKSLRLHKNDQIILFNGQISYLATLTLVSKEAVMAKVDRLLDEESPNTKTTELVLALSLIRIPQFELALQKVTEIGVDGIIPLHTEFSQVQPVVMSASRFARWQKITIEACKQSKQVNVPFIEQVMSFEQLLQADFDLGLFFTFPSPAVNKISPVIPIHKFSEDLKDKQRAILFIGPEGGFSPTEHVMAADAGLSFVSLGQSILRAETAAIVSSFHVKTLLEK